MARARIPNGTGDFVLQSTTFNGDNEDATSGLTEAQPGSFKIECFPNPTSGNLNILFNELPESGKINIRLEDLVGKIIMSQELGVSKKLQLDLSDISSGIYFLNIEVGRKSVVKKIVIN